MTNTNEKMDGVQFNTALGSGCTPTKPASDQSHSVIAFVQALDATGLQFEHVDNTKLAVPVAPSLDPRTAHRQLTNTYYMSYQVFNTPFQCPHLYACTQIDRVVYARIMLFLK